MKVHLVRHGETDWNTQGRIQGWMDVGLNANGRDQIQRLCSHLPSHRSFDLVMSPLRRATESAEILREAADIRGVWVLEEFRELNQGYWNGLRKDVVLRLDGDRYRRWQADPVSLSPPGGESLREVRERVRRGLATILKETDHPVLLVAHKVVISLVAHLAGEWSLEDVLESLPSNAALFELEVLPEAIA